ncbi:hypothetical protein [Coleofasciculus sp. FACHB-129]|uniref:hypothetical protein n=1 Tax=Cyanophyceae TaxID=3028117 RepID=UPI0016855411|nr:hypothetical protein [Coleofasciculus sp. FACHB-129]MBD1897286.1 hypothetical protein [Coleofasciculus sp. FACHB-129]
MFSRIRVGTFLTFWILYLFSSLSLFFTGVLGVKRSDLLFHSDYHRVITQLTTYKINFWRTHTHPLFILVFNPLGFLLKKIIGSGEIVGILFSTFFGAVCVVLTLVFFQKLGFKPFHAILYSAILGLSTSHIFFSSVPDTFIFAACSLIIIYLLAVAYPGSLIYMVLATIFALGMVISNVVQGIIAYFFSIYQGRFNKKVFTKLIIFIGLVLSGAIALNLLQKLIYPSADLFFIPGSYYSKEGDYVNLPDQSSSIFSRILKLLGYIFIFNFIAIKPHIWRTIEDNPPSWVKLNSAPAPWVNFDPPSITALYIPGIIAFLLWTVLLLWSLYAFIKFRADKMPIMRSLIFCILFNFLLHNIYGKDYELFLFTPNWTFLVLSWMALSLKFYSHAEGISSKVLNALLLLFVITQLLNNAQFVDTLVSLYQQSNLSLNKV